MKPLRFILTLLFTISLASVVTLSAFAAGPIEARLVVPDGDWTVGDPIDITLEVTHPAGYLVIAPELDPAWDAFAIQNQSAPVTMTNGDGTETTVINFDARLFAPGSYTTPPLTVSITDGAGNLSEIIAAPLSMEVNSVLIEGDSELRDIRPQATMPLAAMWPYVVGGLIAGLALVAAFIFWLRNRRAPAIDNRLPHQRAFEELVRIAGLHLPQQGQFKEHYTLVSDCVRSYMEETYQIPVVERTTDEIRSSFKRSDISADVTSQFVDFLNKCDVVKFSTFTPDVDNANRLLTLAIEIVERNKPEPGEQNTSEDSPSGPTIITNRPAEVSV